MCICRILNANFVEVTNAYTDYNLLQYNKACAWLRHLNSKTTAASEAHKHNLSLVARGFIQKSCLYLSKRLRGVYQISRGPAHVESDDLQIFPVSTIASVGYELHPKPDLANTGILKLHKWLVSHTFQNRLECSKAIIAYATALHDHVTNALAPTSSTQQSLAIDSETINAGNDDRLNSLRAEYESAYIKFEEVCTESKQVKFDDVEEWEDDDCDGEKTLFPVTVNMEQSDCYYSKSKRCWYDGPVP